MLLRQEYARKCTFAVMFYILAGESPLTRTQPPQADHKYSGRNHRMSKKQDQIGPAAGEDVKVRRWRLEDLLSGARETVIEHEGQDYKLRITSNGKLILTK